MPSFASILVATFIGLAAAAPSPELHRRNCPVGTSYYHCFVGGGKVHQGCYKQYPCGEQTGVIPTPVATGASANPPKATNIVLVPISRVQTSAIPSETPSVTPSACPSQTKQSIPYYETPLPAGRCNTWNPDIWNVFPNTTDPNHPKFVNSTGIFMVSQGYNQTNRRDAILVFKLDKYSASESKSCGIGWTQPFGQTIFGHYGPARMSVSPIELKGKTFLEAVNNKVSFESVKPLIGEWVSGPDVTNWPQFNGVASGSTGSVPCAKELALYVSVDITDSSALNMERVIIMETKPEAMVAEMYPGLNIGWRIGYDC